MFCIVFESQPHPKIVDPESRPTIFPIVMYAQWNLTNMDSTTNEYHS